MNFNKIFDIFGKKIFYSAAVLYWFVFFFGNKVDFDLKNISNENYKLIIVTTGLLSTAVIVVDALSVLYNLTKNLIKKSFAKKKNRDDYFKAINLIKSYRNIDGLGILLALYTLPSSGHHHQKVVPQKYQQKIFRIVNNFSNISINHSSFYFDDKLIVRTETMFDSIYAFEFHEGFFNFLSNYFEKNPHQPADLLNFTIQT